MWVGKSFWIVETGPLCGVSVKRDSGDGCWSRFAVGDLDLTRSPRIEGKVDVETPGVEGNEASQ